MKEKGAGAWSANGRGREPEHASYSIQVHAIVTCSETEGAWG